MRIKNVLPLNNPFAPSDIKTDYPPDRQLDICNREQNGFLIQCPRNHLSRFKVLQMKQENFLKNISKFFNKHILGFISFALCFVGFPWLNLKITFRFTDPVFYADRRTG